MSVWTRQDVAQSVPMQTRENARFSTGRTRDVLPAGRGAEALPARLPGHARFGLQSRSMKPLLALALLSISLVGSHGLNAQAPAPSCEPTAGLTFICGLQNPEDVVLVPATRWLLASGMAPGAGLTAVDTQTKRARKLYAPGAAAVRADKTRFGNCPGPLDPAQAVLHGLALRSSTGGRYTVYATNHGGRESVEVFELNVGTAGDQNISASWIGC